jgi:hypothetical protein
VPSCSIDRLASSTLVRRAFPCGAALLLACISPVIGAAQGGFAVRGSVSDAAGGPLGYSVVSIVSSDRQTLTDDGGRFVFAKLDAGSYRIRARHLGFAPLDTVVVLHADADLTLELRLEHVAVQLAEMRVVAPGPCVNPGPPDPAREPTLAVIFGQLRENAERAVVLARQFPFVFQMERRMTERSPNEGMRATGLDTTVVDGAVAWPYHAGRVISIVNERGKQTRQLNIPGLMQLADSGFHDSHCFHYGGVEKVGGQRYIRVNFEANITIGEPDIEGIAYLDPDGFQVRRIVMSLTHPERLDPTMARMQVTSVFRELVPSIVILDSVEGVTSFEMPAGTPLVRTERQKTVNVVFTRGAPPGATPP